MFRPILLALLLSPLAPPVAAWEVPFFGSSDSEEGAAPAAGGREWWRKHKKKAEFIPGKGYRVEGFEGFFDGSGVPITAAVDEQTIRLEREPDDEGGLLPGLDPKKAAERVKEAAGYGPDQRVAEELFREGEELFRAQKHGPAATKFEAAASRWPGTDLAAKALFNLGECRFFEDDYKEASDAYIELLDKHPSTPKLDAAIERLWSIAQYWEKNYFDEDWHAPLDYRPFAHTVPKLDTVGHAVRLYDAIRLNDPTGPRADDAIMATAGIHFRRHRYADADYHYTLLREEYPRSDHQFQAHLLGLQAKMRRYRGPDYDGTALREAERLEQSTRANFTGRLEADEVERLTEMRAQIARAIEERDLRMAEYYAGTDHNAAAKYYLNRVVEEHPDSPAAEQARSKIEELADAPDKPEVPLEWLVNLLPENKQFESINSVDELAPAPATVSPPLPGSRGTMVAEGPAPGGATTTR